LFYLSSVEICSSFFDECTDEPKMTGSSLAANGEPGRAHKVGVVWVLLGAGVFSFNSFLTCCQLVVSVVVNNQLFIHTIKKKIRPETGCC